jgi:hypothetical protein
MGGTLAIGISMALFLFFSGSWILNWTSAWRPYTAFVSQMAILTTVHAFRLATACFINYEMACSRFRFLVHYGVLLGVEVVVLYSLTGYRFFAAYVPDSWIAALAAFDPCRLNVVLGVMLVFSLLPFGAALAHALSRLEVRHSGGSPAKPSAE